MKQVESPLDELRTFIRRHFGIPENDEDFNDDVHLFDYGYIDSFGAVELISFLKERYAVEVTDSDLIAFPLNTVRQIADFTVKRLSSGR